MKHLFIINPAAGKYDKTGEITQKVREACDKRCLAYEVLVSRQAGDCQKLAQAAAATGDPVRIYACGGDGTLNEIINGVIGQPNAAVTHFPAGSGNDFIKLFSDPTAFCDVGRLIDGEVARFDLIRCLDEHYALNICSMGFDARIGTSISKYKRLPLLSGSGAYILSTGVNLIKGIQQHYVIELDGERIDGRQSLICIANGRWYGGGFNPVPEAEPDDGLLDVLIVKGVSRLTVANVIGKYKAGKHAELGDIIRHRRCKSITIHCDKPAEINLDGELLYARDVTFEVVPQAVRFFYPKGLTYHAAVSASV